MTPRSRIHLRRLGSIRLLTISIALIVLGGLLPFGSVIEDASNSFDRIRFEDLAEQAGLDFFLDNYASETKHMAEPMTGGVALFDSNNNGRLDVFFANGAKLPELEKTGPQFHNRFYRNEGNLTFRDVTDEVGLRGAGFSMGVAAADFDNDGWIDLFVAGVFRNILYRNRGDGTFEEVTELAGIHSNLWSVAAGWFDYDNDGWLDLFVVNYVEYDPHDERFCGDRARNIRVYCHPRYFRPVHNQLYRNRGDGTFEDVTEASGIGRHRGRGMSVAFEDFDKDGHHDAFVTNDNLPNFLFRNRGNGTFEEVALMAGAALRDYGKPVASMGVDFRDYDNDGWPDISVTALAGETYPLFRNLGKGQFEDATFSSALSRLTIQRSGWGNGFYDLDNDGWKDLFTANSHVNDLIHLFESSVFKEPNSVFQNRRDGTFQDVSDEVGEAFQTPRAHRGAAFGDLTGSGLIDAIVTSVQDRAELWINRTQTDNNWIILRLEGTKSNRDGIGALVRIGNQYNRMTTAVGYASSSHSGVHFGLGKATTIPEIAISWPSGVRQTLTNVSVNQVLQVREPSN